MALAALLAVAMTALMLAPYAARARARQLATRVLAGEEQGTWRAACQVASIRGWVPIIVVVEAVSIAFVLGIDSDWAIAVPVALAVSLVGGAIWDRARTSRLSYWMEVSESLDAAVQGCTAEVQEEYRMAKGGLTHPRLEEREAALRRILGAAGRARPQH
jgi:hypothetical protein